MGTLVSIDHGFAALALHRAVDAVTGHPVEGRWEGDRFRMSYRAGAGWTLSLQLQPLEDSVYWVIAPHAHCGRWKEVALYESQTDALKVAREFLVGSKVWREAYLTNLGPVPAAVIGANLAHAEIACGEAPRGSHA